MAEPAQRPPRREGAGIEIAQRDPIACVDLRGSPANGRFMRAVASVTDVAPPGQPCTSVSGLFGSILWLGPDEWLIASETQAGDEIAARLAQALAGIPAAVTDVSDARIIYMLAGENARGVLAKGCSIDLHPRAFQPGRCVQTLLAKAHVLIHARAAQCFDVHVPRSYAPYAWAWLENAQAEYAR
jgi:sarcosine oxidase subunit gamma